LTGQPDFGPLAKHHRSFRSFPPKTLLGRLGVPVVNTLEGVMAGSSIIPDAPVYDSHTFPWVREIEADWRLVREELDQIMSYRDQMPSFHEIIKEVSTITTDNDWKTFFLMGVGLETSENARRCPNTIKVLKKIPGVTTAMFSILSPGKHIPPHRGPYAGVLRLHLGLLVPEPRARCRQGSGPLRRQLLPERVGRHPYLSRRSIPRSQAGSSGGQSRLCPVSAMGLFRSDRT
jgi:beta-hydroxylase